MIKGYNYIKCPEDRLYLRVGNLLRDLKYFASKLGNLEAYGYLRTIELKVRPESPIEEVKESEKLLISPDFLNQNCFRDLDRENMKPIIREYKLRMINI
jgi:hypothetical protein